MTAPTFLAFSFGRALIRLSFHMHEPGDCEERLENPGEQLDADQLTQGTYASYVTSRQEEGAPDELKLGGKFFTRDPSTMRQAQTRWR